MSANDANGDLMVAFSFFLFVIVHYYFAHRTHTMNNTCWEKIKPIFSTESHTRWMPESDRSCHNLYNRHHQSSRFMCSSCVSKLSRSYI